MYLKAIFLGFHFNQIKRDWYTKIENRIIIFQTNIPREKFDLAEICVDRTT